MWYTSGRCKSGRTIPICCVYLVHPVDDTVWEIPRASTKYTSSREPSGPNLQFQILVWLTQRQTRPAVRVQFSVVKTSEGTGPLIWRSIHKTLNPLFQRKSFFILSQTKKHDSGVTVCVVPWWSTGSKMSGSINTKTHDQQGSFFIRDTDTSNWEFSFLE